MAQAVKPASAIGPIWWRYEYQLSGNPWTIRTSGPSPSTTARMRALPASIVRNSRNLVSSPGMGLCGFALLGRQDDVGLRVQAKGLHHLLAIRPRLRRVGSRIALLAARPVADHTGQVPRPFEPRPGVFQHVEA